MILEDKNLLARFNSPNTSQVEEEEFLAFANDPSLHKELANSNEEDLLHILKNIILMNIYIPRFR